MNLTQLKNLYKEYKHFQNFLKYEEVFKNFFSPFSVNASTAPDNLQLEIIDLQINFELKTIFENNTDLINL